MHSTEWVASLVFFLALGALVVRVAYGLRRPQFWMYAGLVVLVGLPLVFGMIEVSMVFGLASK